MIETQSYVHYHNKEESHKKGDVYLTTSKLCSEIQEVTKLAKNSGKAHEVFAKVFRIGSTAFDTDEFSDVTFAQVFDLVTVTLHLNKVWKADDTQEQIEKAVHKCFEEDSPNRKAKVVMHNYLYQMYGNNDDLGGL